MRQVLIDPAHVERLPRQRDARADRPRAVPRQQRLDLRRGNRVAAGAVVEHAELVLQLLWPVDRDRHADAFLGKELDHVRPEQRRVRGEAEVDVFARLPRRAGAHRQSSP